MSQKVRKTLIMIVMAALIICLMAASLTYTFTYGRYAGGKFNSTESPYDDLIEFVGAREYTVRSPEELIQAIKDGYSNIVIAEDAEEPFVITEGVTDVEANLVLNLNGKVVVRNSRNPMLDVQTNVSGVLVYDSKQTGAFYNPVGSSLMASGGSLTVGSGGYESGPRAKEYQGNEAAGTLSKQPSDVAIYTRGGITSPSAVDRTEQLSYTKIDTKIDASSNFVPATSGRYYRETADSDYTLVPADTFLIYTVEKDCFIGDGTSSGDVKFELGQLYVDAESEKVDNDTIITASEFTKPLCNVASCDFYYYYPISEEDENGFRDYAVIYGYWDVMKLAQDDDGAATALKSKGLIYPYGAVRMVEGEGIVRGGTFSNHFDAVNTYGIYAEGGTLSVSQNTTVDTTFTTGDEGVCIRVQSATEETTTTGEATTTGGSLTISGGEFSSEIGNTIEMSGGKMTVTAGKFTKDASSADTNSTDNGSAIDIQGGTLNMAGAETAPVSFTVTGNYVNGVRVGDPTTSTVTETATIENAVFNFNKGEGSNSVAGVRSFGGTLTVRSSTFNISNGATSGKTITRAAGLSTQGGTVMATACIFNFAQENATVFPTASAGISSLGGTVTATDSTFTIPGNNNYGIYSSITSGVTGENQYDTKAANCTFKLTGNSNHGIYAAGGKTLASGGTITLIGSGQNSDNFGIYSQSGTTTAEGCTITITGTYSAGALSYNGTIYLNDNTVIKVTESGVSTGDNTLLTSSAVSSEASTSGDHPINMNGNVTITSDGLGITARGNINVQSGKTTITTERATGIYVQGGILTVLEKAVVEVNSEIDSTCSWVVPPEHTDDESLQTNIYNGVFVNGGSLESTGTLNVTFTGVQNADFNTETQEGKVNTSYLNQQIKSYAVRVDNGNATIVLGEIKNGVGGGVLVNGGTVKLGAENAANADLTVSTSGRDSDGQNHFVTTDNQWQYDWTLTGGHAVAVEGGTLNIYSGTYTAQMGNGILVRNLASDSTQNTVTVKDGIFEGYNGIGRRVGPGAFYALKVMGGPLTLNINGGTFGKALANGVAPSTNGGAFVMGNPDAKKRATVNVTNASFNSYNSDTFAVFRYVEATFQETSEVDQISMTVTKASTDTNNYAAIGVQNDFVYNNNDHPYRGSTITIEDGTYSGGFGIWYGSSVDKVNISGGTFTGTGSSGLWFEVNPGSNKVQLSGGTYYGKDNDVRLTHSWEVPQPSNNSTYNAIDGKENIAYSQLLVSGHSANGDTEYNGSVNDGSDSADGGFTTQTGGLSRIKDQGSVEVEWYGIWYRTNLVYSKITISNS